MFRKFSQWFDSPPAGKAASKTAHGGRKCELEGCLDEGIYRAPKSRYHLEACVDDWYWFCLIHIRDYNARWNYYTNMSERQIEEERRSDVTWQRPTWPLGSDGGFAGGGSRARTGQTFQDPFDLFPEDLASINSYYQEKYPAQSKEAKALSLFGLSFPLDALDLQKRYRELVKKYHPDANGGSPESEETLKRINEAYGVLKSVC